MGVFGVILLVAFIIVCVLLVCVVLVQNTDSSGMGGLLGGSNSKAFGSRSGNVLTKTTYILVTLFFVSSLVLALTNKTQAVAAPLPAAETEQRSAAEYWLDTNNEDQDTAGTLNSDEAETPTPEEASAQTGIENSPDMDNTAAQAAE